MIVSAGPSHALPILEIELGLTLLGIAMAFVWPRLGSAFFSRMERAFSHLARRQRLAVAAVGISTAVLRLLILPFIPIPLPFVPDDFSFLFSADTFAHGRLTNPTPAMWVHFETIHITMQPTWMSMYFPGEGLVLAAGKILLGHPWYGLLIASALMCAAICWMLQAWMPPNWALLGGCLAIFRLGLFSYWINSYTGGGSISALGGAFVLGALPRLMRTAKSRHALVLALGIVLLGLTRPFEGLLLCIPVTVVLGHRMLFGKRRPSMAVLLPRAAAPIALIVAAAAWMGYYDYRAFDSPFTLPYTANRAAYAIAPYYVWQPPHAEPLYRHESMRRFYHDNELESYSRIHSLSGFIPQTLMKVVVTVLFFAGFALLPPLIMLRRVLLDQRIRFLLVCALILAAGMLIEVFLIPHYLAAFTAAFYAIGLQAMRHMRLWSPGGNPVGLTLVRLTVTLCIALAGLRLIAAPLGLKVADAATGGWTGMWFGPDHNGTERALIQSELEQQPGKQLAIVRPGAKRNSLEQWVYNDPDIDASKVVWAIDMDSAHNKELMDYYRERKVWLVQMDTQPATVSPYPIPKR